MTTSRPTLARRLFREPREARRGEPMKIARVVGTVVSTVQAPAFAGRRLLLCDFLDLAGRPAGGYTIAIDAVGAGAGETVLILDEGNSARQVLMAPDAPVRAVVVGIVDAVTLANGAGAAR